MIEFLQDPPRYPFLLKGMNYFPMSYDVWPIPMRELMRVSNPLFLIGISAV